MPVTRTMIYLDHAAATPVRREVLRAMAPYSHRLFGNPGSITSPGIIARKAVDSARQEIANLLGVHQDELIFTGSGTESANLAIQGIVAALDGQPEKIHIITSPIEHQAVRAPIVQLANRGYQVSYAPINQSGILDPQLIQKAIRPTTRFISVMAANNEIGTLQPIREISRIIRRCNKEREQQNLPRIYLHTDACQVAAYSDLRPESDGLDALTLNAAKIGGPKGIGLLYLRRGTPLVPLIFGGGQEADRRAGTENVAAIVGFAVALRLAVKERSVEVRRLQALRDRLLAKLRQAIPNIQLNGDPAQRLPGNLSLMIPGVEAEVLLPYLDRDGVIIGTGAACSTLNLEPSHVLRAIGLSDQDALQTVRITLGRETTVAEVADAGKIISARITWLRTHLN